MLMFERLFVRTADAAVRNQAAFASRVLANGLATGVSAVTGADISAGQLTDCCYGYDNCEGTNGCDLCQNCGCPSGGACWLSSGCPGECCDYDCGDYICIQYHGDES